MKNAACVFATCLTLALVPAAAPAQTLGKYLLDGSNTVWFIQITDTHIDSTGLVGWYPDHMPWALGECADTVNPLFFVVTGDLTDHTCGALGNYLGKPCDEEWQAYRKIVDDHGMTPDTYFDVPGNHDAYGEGTLDHYLKFSLQGSDTGSTQQSWRVDFPQQHLHFFSVATPGNDGAQWPFDNVEFTQAELDEVKGFLTANADAEFQMGFGHHDYMSAKRSADMENLFTQYGVNYYAHGHVHDLKVTMDGDNILRLRIDSLGQGKGNNVAIWAVDNLTLTAGIYDAQSGWPKVVVTAPASQEIDWGGVVRNPHNPSVPKSCTGAPVRALVFDPQTVVGATFAIDNGSETPMTPRQSNPFQWRGTFDATALAAGRHTVTVSVTASNAASATNAFYVEDGPPCDLGPEDPDIPRTDGGTTDAGHVDASLPDGEILDAGSGADASSNDTGVVEDTGGAGADGGEADDTGTTEDAAVQGDGGETPQRDGGRDTGVPAGDGGTPSKDAGASGRSDAGGLKPPDSGSPAEAGGETGCSCAVVGL